MSKARYGKYGSDGLWSIKWIKWTMVYENSEMVCGRWNKWDGLCYVKTTKMEWWWENIAT